MTRMLAAGLMAAIMLMLPGFAAAGPFPTWSDKIVGASRFKVLNEFDGEAVLDKETGLVWEQQPSSSTMNWGAAQSHCLGRIIGNRRGWRLPALEELASLQDPSQTGIKLPPGHPFSVLPIFLHWSATTDAADATEAHALSFGGGGLFQVSKAAGELVWCTRGGRGTDGGH